MSEGLRYIPACVPEAICEPASHKSLKSGNLEEEFTFRFGSVIGDQSDFGFLYRCSSSFYRTLCIQEI